MIRVEQLCESVSRCIVVELVKQQTTLHKLELAEEHMHRACAYLSDGLRNSIATARVREAYCCVQTDLVADRHIHGFSAAV